MKPRAATIRKWVKIYSEEMGGLSEEQVSYIYSISGICDYEELPEGSGFILYMIAKDFDCKKRMSVLVLYCRPEKRGLYLRYIFRRLEEIARAEGVVEVAIGHSISGYKEDKFERMLTRMGYEPSIYSKRV